MPPLDRIYKATVSVAGKNTCQEYLNQHFKIEVINLVKDFLILNDFLGSIDLYMYKECLPHGPFSHWTSQIPAFPLARQSVSVCLSFLRPHQLLQENLQKPSNQLLHIFVRWDFDECLPRRHPHFIPSPPVNLLWFSHQFISDDFARGRK